MNVSTWSIRNPIPSVMLFVLLTFAGLLSFSAMKVQNFPDIDLPMVMVTAALPGASPGQLENDVARKLENSIATLQGLKHVYTKIQDGSVSLTAEFELEKPLQEAVDDVRSAVSRVRADMPADLRDPIINKVDLAGQPVLAFTVRASSMDDEALSWLVDNDVARKLLNVPGVGAVNRVGGVTREIRIALDPQRLQALGASAADISRQLRQVQRESSGGRTDIGDSEQPVRTLATVGTAEELASLRLVLSDGRPIRLSDVASVTDTIAERRSAALLDGQPVVGFEVARSRGASELDVAAGVQRALDELKAQHADLQITESFNFVTPVQEEYDGSMRLLYEGALLAVLVVWLFLRDWRATMISAVALPLSVIPAFAGMYLLGFSINVITLLALSLVIGILVDDAIVVIENVERIMAEEGLSPREATRKAMGQITGAIIGITLVLTAVFVPMAFFPGAVGIIYQQFSLTMVVSILFSGLLALSLTPALCATFLKPIKQGHHQKKGFFGWFNRRFDAGTRKYAGMVGFLVHRAGRFMVIYLAIVGGLAYLFLQLPSSFLPNEDQGYIIVDMQAPAEASANRALSVADRVDAIFAQEPAIDQRTMISGFSFSGFGDNAGLAFVTLKDWKERGPNDSAEAISGRANGQLFGLRDALTFALSPPPIQGLGNSGGFTFRLQDRSGAGATALSAAAGQLMATAGQSPILVGMRIEGMPDAAQLNLNIDREKANTFGVTFADINSTISANLGSTYINDFPNAGRMQRVTVQADQYQRMSADGILNLNVPNAAGGMVPLRSFATVDWTKGPAQVVGYNGYPAVRIAGNAAPGYSSGAAIAEMERLAAQLPTGFGYEWSGQSLQEIQSGSQAPMLVGLTILFIFLLLAALYESWSIPLSVMLVVPLGVIGSVVAVMLRDMPNDVYFKVGLITIIGLSAKNAILIVEFAKDLRAEGKPLLEATIEACQLRFRPILMTSLAFTLGVVPLAIATGASAASQNAIGTGVLGGMISATVLAIFFVPVFFVFVMKLFGKTGQKSEPVAEQTAQPAE